VLERVTAILSASRDAGYDLPAPAGFAPQLPVEDDPVELTADDILGRALAIHYVDAKGDESYRRITIRRLHPVDSRQFLIGAYCHEREAYRSFRSDRVIQVIDLLTGEVSDQPWDFFRSLADICLTGRAIELAKWELQVFAFIGRCDGHFDELEQDWAADYVGAAWPKFSPPHEVIVRHVSQLFPDQESFIFALKKLPRSCPDNKRFLRSLRRILDADGRLDQTEAELAMVITEELSAD
jgi:hypothetical protein